MNKWKTIA